MAKNILYIHGFNSAGGGHKAQLLQEMFPECKVLSPTFDCKNPQAIRSKLDSLMRTQNIRMVIGTSLGGFFALYCSMKHHKQAVIINPTTKPSQTLRKFIGKQKNFVTGEVYQVTEADIAKYEKFEDDIMAGLEPDNNLVHFVLATDDELLGDHTYLEQKFSQCHDFNYFDGQGHRFTSVKIIRHILQDALSKA
ncbi:MAG: hypothetical protein IK013_02900 [Bacteroidales bacterium]|nr:hypothetical protein [Bacteroidales bacterium]